MLSSFFTVIRQDPVLSRVKLVAEPWDVGEGGYQVGNFPVGWSEWNGRYRDAVRAFFRGDGRRTAELGYRLTGSSDLYGDPGKAPHASVNFVTAHDGATMADLVTYAHKHNEANGEDNRDGADHEGAWNEGVEGPTDDPEIRARRLRQVRNLMATLLLSQGTPMIAHGDELLRTQRGNNNAYCQDNEISWIDWELGDDARAMLAFTRKLVGLRRAQRSTARRSSAGARSAAGRSRTSTGCADGPRARGRRLGEPTRQPRDVPGRGRQRRRRRGRVRSDDLFLVLNGSVCPLAFVLPAASPRRGPGRRARWARVVDTNVVGTRREDEAGGSAGRRADDARARSLSSSSRRARDAGPQRGAGVALGRATS